MSATGTEMIGLTPDAARVLTDEVKADAAALWSKLLNLYEGGAHKALGYSSWGTYYAAEFGQASSTGYRLLEAARAVALIPMRGNEPAPSQNAARELVPVLREDPDRVEEVWDEVVHEHGPKPTAVQVREHVGVSNAPVELAEYAFVTTIRFHHGAAGQREADAWAQRLAGRAARTPGVVCLSRETKVV